MTNFSRKASALMAVLVISVPTVDQTQAQLPPPKPPGFPALVRELSASRTSRSPEKYFSWFSPSFKVHVDNAQVSQAAFKTMIRNEISKNVEARVISEVGGGDGILVIELVSVLPNLTVEPGVVHECCTGSRAVRYHIDIQHKIDGVDILNAPVSSTIEEIPQ